jgi:hypothetical protein
MSAEEIELLDARKMVKSGLEEKSRLNRTWWH